MPLRFIDLAVLCTIALFADAGTRSCAGEPGIGESLFRSVCVTCHGGRGEGKQELFAPPLVGLPPWYVRTQLDKFRLGHRGLPPDHAGAVMRSIALALPPATLPDVAEFAHSLDWSPRPTSNPPQPEWVREYYLEQCAPCHRYNGRGDQVFAAAPLSVFPRWYLESALRKFRDRVRGNHPQDEQGKKMQAVAALLSDEIIRELASYISGLAQRYPPK